MNTNEEKGKIHWIKALLNGFLAWVIGFILYMGPAFIVAFKMALELGPKTEDPSAVSEQISQAIPGIYQDNLLLLAGFFIVTTLLLFWRARAVAKGSGEKKIMNGVIVTFIPVVLSLLFMCSTGFNILSLFGILLFMAAGYGGGYYSK